MQVPWHVFICLARTRNDFIRTQQITSVVIGLGLGLVAWWLVAKWRAKHTGGRIDYKAKEGWLVGLFIAICIIATTFLMIHYDVNTLSDDEIPPSSLQLP